MYPTNLSNQGVNFGFFAPGKGALNISKMERAMKRQTKILMMTEREELIKEIESFLEKQNFALSCVSNPSEAIHQITKEDIGIVLLDIYTFQNDVIETVKNIKKYNPNTVIIILVERSTIEIAIEALKYGAYDFITIPIEKDKVLKILYKAIEKNEMLREISRLREEIQERYGFENIIGKSKAMTEIFELIKKAASIAYPVLIQGESGTGKELVAKVIHYNSPRRYKRFVKVNIAKFDEDLLERFLFGQYEGDMSETSSHKGAFFLAHEGTIFFDEISEMSLRIQEKLLKVLQDKEIMLPGHRSPVKVDVRIIAATSKDLQQAVAKGAFKEELFYRLSVINIQLPPLRERKEDIPLLALHFLKRYAEEAGREVKGFTPMAMELLLNYHWPGNVRELENVIQSAVFLETGEHITTKALNYDGRFSSLPRMMAFTEEGIIPYAEAKKQFEREYILRALEICGGNVSLVARKTGIIRTNLYKKFKKLNIDPRQIPRRRINKKNKKT